MIYVAHINIMPLDDLLDPQGKAIRGALHNIGVHAVKEVRMGKHIVLQIQAESAEQAAQIAESAATQLLANQVMEQYDIKIMQ